MLNYFESLHATHWKTIRKLLSIKTMFYRHHFNANKFTIFYTISDFSDRNFHRILFIYYWLGFRINSWFEHVVRNFIYQYLTVKQLQVICKWLYACTQNLIYHSNTLKTLQLTYLHKCFVKYWLIKRQSCHHIDPNQLICSANQLTSFYTMTTSAFNELK